MIKRNNLYLIFYSTFTAYWFINYIMQTSTIDTTFVCRLLLIIGFIAFVVNWIYTKYTLKEYVVQLALVSFLVFTYIKSGSQNEGILTIFMAVSGIKDLDIKKITKVMLYTLTFLFTMLIFFTIIGIIPYDTYIKSDAFGNTYTMIKIAGQHGNPLYIVVFNIVSLYLYTYIDKITLRKCCVIQIILIIFYMLFASKTGVILGTISLWGTYFIKHKKNTNNNNKHYLFRFIISNSYLIMFLIVYIVAKYCYGTAVFTLLNKVVQSRIYEAYFYITDKGISLLPKAITYYYICDNSQTYIMVSLGLLFTVIYLFLYYKAIRNLLKRRMYIEVFFMVIYLLYSYSETTFIKPFSNFSILFLIYAFYPKREKEKKLEQ